jgi:atypical dual specificity phosphatase
MCKSRRVAHRRPPPHFGLLRNLDSLHLPAMLAFSSPRQQPLANATVAVATQRGRGRCASEVQPRLYLSDYSSATDPALLATLRVSHIVCCMEDAPALRNGLQRLHVPVSDVPSADLGVWFARTNAWIADALADPANVVLVHCLMVRVSPPSSFSPTDVSIGHEVRLWSVPALDARAHPAPSRSATVVCAYLIWTRHLHAPDAIAFVRARRAIVRPNSGFVRQLEAFSDTVDRAVPPPKLALAHSAATLPVAYVPALKTVELKVAPSLASKIRRYMANRTDDKKKGKGKP